MPNNIDGRNMENATLFSDKDSTMKNHIQNCIAFLANNKQETNNVLTLDNKSLGDKDFPGN